jgi:hypothetical protein
MKASITRTSSSQSFPSRLRGRSMLAWRPRLARTGLVALLAPLLAVLVPATGQAAVATFGSPLSVPATLNTAENLSYQGTYTAVPPAPDAPNGVVHTYHYGADSALWNVAVAGGAPQAPAAGQVLKVSLEGCAQQAAGAPPPLTQIHFQDLSPLPGGAARVNVTSQSFDIPVCGQNGAGGSTVTSYEPVNLCMNQGDYLDFNDDGGYVENGYRSGVPYQVLGSVPGSTADSFIKGGGTGNGAVFSPSDSSAMEGFASNANEELMLQVTLGTGPDATPLCPGGTRGVQPHVEAPPTTPVRLSPQTDGVNHSRVVAVAIYCRLSAACQGVAGLAPVGAHSGKAKYDRYGSRRFSIRGRKTSHVAIRVTPRVIRMLRKHHRGARVLLSVTVGGKTVTQAIQLRIF